MTRSVLLAIVLAAGTAQAQLPCWIADYGTNLALGDESVSAPQALGFSFAFDGAAWTAIQVCDNGYVTLGGGGGQADPDPDPVALNGAAFARICPFWVDLDPSAGGSGNVWFNAVPANGTDPAHAVITWRGVYEFRGLTPHTFQLVLVDGGAIRCAYGQDIAHNTSPWLVGASPGANATANAVTFLSTPFSTSAPVLHENDPTGGASALENRTIEWLPNGAGGYDVADLTGCAAFTEFGSGCVAAYTSFYEFFPTTAAIDLANTAFELTLNAGAYDVSSSSVAFVPPSATAFNLNLADDAETTVLLATPLPYPGGSATMLTVGSNGHVAIAPNGAAFDFSPSPAELLSWPNAAWAVWRDLIPDDPASGGVFFEEIGNVSIITWDAVVGYDGQVPGVTPSTFQFQFDRSTGNVAIVFGALDTTSVSTWPGGDGWLIGYSPGGPALDPGNFDLSTLAAAGPLGTAATDIAPLTITADAPPAMMTQIGLVVDNVSPTAAFVGVVFGFQKFDPGMSLAGIGMPDCFQYGNQLSVQLVLPGGATQVTVPFLIPRFAGVRMIVQAAGFDPASNPNPLGVVASNGLELMLGN